VRITAAAPLLAHGHAAQLGPAALQQAQPAAGHGLAVGLAHHVHGAGVVGVELVGPVHALLVMEDDAAHHHHAQQVRRGLGHAEDDADVVRAVIDPIAR
jgi:hypothetical protein